jgi:hypothetical protein
MLDPSTTETESRKVRPKKTPPTAATATTSHERHVGRCLGNSFEQKRRICFITGR